VGAIPGRAAADGVRAAGRAGWSIERRADSVGALHGPWPGHDASDSRGAALCSVAGPPALVLGSTQRDDVVDGDAARRAGVEVVRRGSGGGAVLVVPGAQVWLDVWVPRGDPLWDDDVIASSGWLGEVWARALGTLGAPALHVHRDRVTPTEWPEVCFAAVGPGEVVQGSAKVVGIAQRRTRAGARLYSTAPLSWEPESLLRLLAHHGGASEHIADAPASRDARSALDSAATGLRRVLQAVRDDPDATLTAAVEDALLHALTSM
jgi:lipoate-protein ligase A